LLEPVSKPSEDYHHTGELGEAVEEKRVVLVSSNKSAKRVQATDGAFDDPAAAIAA
jgi:hypothetical protein